MKQTKRLSVLYAEDNEDSGFMLMTLLGFSDIEVLLARSVKEAFRSAQKRHFDLFLLDSKFPDGSGLELCRQLRFIAPKTPIVFYSGDAFETDREKGLKAGADAYLVKPEVDTVTSTILQLLTQMPETKGNKNPGFTHQSPFYTGVQITPDQIAV